MNPSQLPDIKTLVCVDTEGSGLHPDDGATVSVVSVAWREDDGTITAYAWPFDQGFRDKPLPARYATRAHTLFDTDYNLPQEEWVALMRWLEGRILTCHNAKYDLHMLRTGTRHWEGTDLLDQVVWDTQLAQTKLEPQESSALKATAVRLWGPQEGEAEQHLATHMVKIGRDKRYDLVAWTHMEDYATKDAEQGIRLAYHQLNLLDEGAGPLNARLLIDRELRLLRALYSMERRGVQFDRDRSRELAQRIILRAEEYKDKLPFKPSTPAAKLWYFGTPSNRGKYFAYASSGSKEFALDEEVLRKMVADGLPHAADYHTYMQLTRAASMWYDGYADACGDDGRLRTSYKQTFVKSGRMSVERVQLQAIPKNDKALEGIDHIRTCFGAKPGHVLFNLDLSQAELRVAAHYSNCQSMLDALLTGADFHGLTCQRVIGTQPGSPDWKRDRDIAKRLTFGSIFLIGGKRFRETLKKLAGIDMPLEQCEQIVRNWRKEYPEFGWIYNSLDKWVWDKGYTLTLPGDARKQIPGPMSERSWFGPRDKPHTAWNRVVQGSLAAFNKVWLAHTEKWAAELGVPEALVLNVHDSTVLELPTSEASDLAAEMALRGGALATSVFGVEMKVDVEPWAKFIDVAPADRPASQAKALA